MSVAAALTFCWLPLQAQSGAPPVFVQVPFISTVAGGTTCAGAVKVDGTNYGDGCPATQVTITSPYSTAVDKWGNVYYAATPSAGIVQVIYAGAVTVGGVANPATAMIEAANPAVTSAPVAGDVYTVAGGLTGAPSSCADGATLSGNGSGCAGTDSYIKKAYGVAVDGDGNVFLLDESESNAYVVLANATDLAAQFVTLEDPSVTAPKVGSIYLIAGTGGGYKDGVLATSGEIHGSYGISVDANENLYIADYTNDAVRMINGPKASNPSPLAGSYAPGYIHTIAGKCTSSSCTALSGTPASGSAAIGAEFVDPAGIAVDAAGNVYVGDNADSVSGVPVTVRMIYAGGANNPAAHLIDIEADVSSPTAGYIYTVAGSKNSASAVGNGSLATATTVGFDRIYGLALDSRGNIYIADYNGAGQLAVAEVNGATGYLSFISGGSAASSLGSGDFCSGGSTGPTMTDSYGDGCPATQSSSHHAEGNLAFDASGNLYYADNGNGFIRKLTFSSFPTTAVGNPAATQTLAFSLLTGSSSEAASNVAVSVVMQGTAIPEFADPGTNDTCTGSTNLVGFPNNATTQSNSTCVVPVNFAPAKAGLRSGAVRITATINSTTATYTPAFISGIGQGAALAIDPSTPSTIGSGTAPQGVATDAAGNVYIAWSNGTLSSTPAGPLTTAITGATANPHQVAVDGAGDVFVADTGDNRIAELAAGSASVTTAGSAFGGTNLNAPQGVAVDGAGNLYIADTGNARVLFVPVSGQSSLLGSGFETPVAVAVDASGNVYVADSGLGEIVKIPAGNGTPSALASSVAPVAVAIDAAGDVVYADSSLLEVVEIPAGGTNSVIASGLADPEGVALDANGGVYLADTANTGISYYPRIATTYNFTTTDTQASAVLSNIGNLSYSGTVSSTDSTDFELSDASDNGCSGTTSLALTAGQNCGYSALFTPSGFGNLTDTVTYTGNAVNGSPALMLTGYNAAPRVNTTTAVTLNTTTPTYGAAVQLTITVSANSGSTTPGGTVTYTVDGGAASAAETLVSGAYSFSLSSLSAGSHTISAAYTPGSGANFNASSTASAFSLSVAPIALTATATPVMVSYGQAIPTITGTLGSGVLTQDQGNVSAVFSTSATSTSPVGTYPITVALSGSAAANYTVTLSGTPSVTIQPGTVTVAVANATKTYGSANPSFSGTLSGVSAQDAANVAAVYSTTATAASTVGTYPITVTSLSGSAAGNYTLGTVTSGTLTITPLAITATASAVSATYGQAVPQITGSLSGVLTQDQSNVTPVFTTTATSTSPVGSYPVSVSLSGSAAGNYTVTLSGSPVVTVQPAAVAVDVASASRAYGAVNPVLTGALTGVLAQDAANVAAIYATTATSASPAGSYPITVTGLTGSAAGNYTLGTVTAGVLTVTQAASSTTLTTSAASIALSGNLTLTATVASSTSGTPTGSVTFNNGSTVLGTITLADGVATLSNPQTITQNAGSYSITAVYSGDKNFTGSTSSAVSETVQFPAVGATPSSPTVTINSGGSGTVTLALAAQGGYTGSATFSCANLPTGMTCSFNPDTATFTSTSLTASTTLTISTSGSSGTSALLYMPPAPGRGNGLPIVPALTFWFPAAMAALFGMRSRKLLAWQRRTMLLVLLLAGTIGVTALTGCGAGASSTKTPPGTYTIDVEVTAGTVQMVPITVTVQ